MADLAKQFPTERFVFVMSKLNKSIAFPDNVSVYNDISSDKFQELLSKAKIVVIPLKEDVGSSGQMLCIQAMRNAKPIVYCNVSSISYYFTPQSGYPYELGNIDSLRSSVKDAIAGNISQAGQNAFNESLQFTKKREKAMIEHILDLA